MNYAKCDSGLCSLSFLMHRPTLNANAGMVSFWQIHFLFSEPGARGGGCAPVPTSTSTVLRRLWRSLPCLYSAVNIHQLRTTPSFSALVRAAWPISPGCYRDTSARTCVFIIPKLLSLPINHPLGDRAAGIPVKSESSEASFC